MSPTFARGLTWSALATERSLPLLLLSPFAARALPAAAIVLVIGLHLGFAACMNLGNFVPAMIAYTPNFIPGEDWDALERWWARSGEARRLCGTRVRARLTSSILAPGGVC